MLLVKFNLKFGNSIKIKGDGPYLGLPGFFLDKKLFVRKENLEVIQNHFLLYPTPQMKKPSKNYFDKNMS